VKGARGGGNGDVDGGGGNGDVAFTTQTNINNSIRFILI